MEIKKNRAERRSEQRHGLGRIRDVLETKGGSSKVNKALLNKYIESVEAALNSNDQFERNRIFMQLHNSSPKTFQRAREMVLKKFEDKIK